MVTDWTVVTREVKIDWDLQQNQLQIRRSSAAWSGDKIDLWFYDGEDKRAGGLGIWFSNPMQYYIHSCSTRWSEFSTTPPTDQNNVWTIFRTDRGLEVQCNELLVLDYDISQNTHVNKFYWKREIKKIKFSCSDTTSKEYRTSEPEQYKTATIQSRENQEAAWKGVVLVDISKRAKKIALYDEDKLESVLLKRYCEDSTGNVKICYVAVYTGPLAGSYSISPEKMRNVIGRQWTPVDNHAFVIFQTNDGRWWSLEKNMTGIYIARGHSREAVVNNFQLTPRMKPVQLVVDDKAQYDLTALISMLFIDNDTTSRYSAMNDNCQHFARYIFDKVAAKNYFDFTSPLKFLMFIIAIVMLILGIKMYGLLAPIAGI